MNQAEVENPQPGSRLPGLDARLAEETLEVGAQSRSSP